MKVMIHVSERRPKGGLVDLHVVPTTAQQREDLATVLRKLTVASQNPALHAIERWGPSGYQCSSGDRELARALLYAAGCQKTVLKVLPTGSCLWFDLQQCMEGMVGPPVGVGEPPEGGGVGAGVHGHTLDA